MQKASKSPHDEVTKRFIRSELIHPTQRIPEMYLRDRAIVWLYEALYKETGKSPTASQVAEEFDPMKVPNKRSDRKWKDTGGLFNDYYGKDHGTYIEPKRKWPQKVYDVWQEQFGVGSGDAARKIRHRFLKKSSYRP